MDNEGFSGLREGPQSHIITGTKKYEQMKPVLQEFHWLPVRQRITY